MRGIAELPSSVEGWVVERRSIWNIFLQGPALTGK